jgi:hypothetical protein
MADDLISEDQDTPVKSSAESVQSSLGLLEEPERAESFVSQVDEPQAPSKRDTPRRSDRRRRAWEANRQHWANLLAEWEAGHLTQAEFCEQHNIKIGSFAKWRRRFRDEKRSVINQGDPKQPIKRRRRKMTPERSAFVEVGVAPSRTSAATSCTDLHGSIPEQVPVGTTYEITFPHGIILRLQRNFDTDELRHLLLAINETC